MRSSTALRLFQMGTGMGVLGELGDCRIDRTLHSLSSLPYSVRKPLPDRQRATRLVPLSLSQKPLGTTCDHEEKFI